MTEQVPPLRLQLGLLKAPSRSELKVTLPAGTVLVPTPAVSVTVTVHSAPWSTTTGLAQTTLVELARRLTVMAEPVGSLDAVCLSSDGACDALIVWLPPSRVVGV